MGEKNERSKSKDGRARSWSFIVYPESAPEDWRDRLDTLHVPWAESPLHDKDVNPGTGEVKKAHLHIALNFDGKKSYEQVKEITEYVNGSVPQSVHEMRGLIRYFAHLDNPEKYQYSVSDIIGHGGFDVQGMLKPTASQRYELIREMMDFCALENVTEFADLCDYAMKERYEDWFPLLCDSCSFVMREYVKSRRHKG